MLTTGRSIGDKGHGIVRYETNFIVIIIFLNKPDEAVLNCVMMPFHSSRLGGYQRSLRDIGERYSAVTLWRGLREEFSAVKMSYRPTDLVVAS